MLVTVTLISSLVCVIGGIAPLLIARSMLREGHAAKDVERIVWGCSARRPRISARR
jgi:hypothetical protein